MKPIAVQAFGVGVGCESGMEHLYEMVHPLLSVLACHPAPQMVEGGGAIGQLGVGGGVRFVMLQLSVIIERVRGPTEPHPVDIESPDEMMP